jgi:hypothetical protein
VELYLHSHNTPSWRDDELKKHRDNFTFTLFHFCIINSENNELYVIKQHINHQAAVNKETDRRKKMGMKSAV